MTLCKLLLHARYGLDVLGFILSKRRVLTVQFLLAQKLSFYSEASSQNVLHIQIGAEKLRWRSTSSLTLYK